MNALEIKNLTKNYKEFCLDHLNLTVPSGCIMGLIGENGAGKSTTIKLILEMIKRDEGEITLLGKDAHLVNKEDIGVVFDEPGIPDCITAVQAGRIMKHTFRNWDQKRFDELLGKLSIPTNKLYREYSRGMKMKLGIAIALSHNAKLLILDEATNGLDPVVRDELLDMLLDFTKDEEHSIILSSHIVSDLEKVCDYIAFLHKGRLMLCEEKDVLLEEYGALHCSRADLENIDPAAIIGRKENSFGVDAIVRRSEVPDGMTLGQISIEDLFIFMVKGE